MRWEGGGGTQSGGGGQESQGGDRDQADKRGPGHEAP